jgi:hypothetical protein
LGLFNRGKKKKKEKKSCRDSMINTDHTWVVTKIGYWKVHTHYPPLEYNKPVERICVECGCIQHKYHNEVPGSYWDKAYGWGSRKFPEGDKKRFIKVVELMTFDEALESYKKEKENKVIFCPYCGEILENNKCSEHGEIS